MSPGEKIKRVVLLGPSHKVYLDFVATTSCTEWATPLGNLSIDQDAIKDLTGSPLYRVIDKRHEENEHSLEMHLPYIKKTFPKDVKLLPLMVGELPSEAYEKYGQSLLKYFQDPETVFIVSTDFCHWGSRFEFTHRFPGTATISDSIEQLDRLGMTCIEKHNLKEFTQYHKAYKNTICGRNPLRVLLAVIEAASATEKLETRFLRYAQSSKIEDDEDDSSVSYASAITTS